MQMRRMYSTTDKRARIAAFNAAGNECDAAGYRHMAEVNWEMAQLLHNEIVQAQRDAERLTKGNNGNRNR